MRVQTKLSYLLPLLMIGTGTTYAQSSFSKRLLTEESIGTGRVQQLSVKGNTSHVVFGGGYDYPNHPTLHYSSYDEQGNFMDGFSLATGKDAYGSWYIPIFSWYCLRKEFLFRVLLFHWVSA